MFVALILLVIYSNQLFYPRQHNDANLITFGINFIHLKTVIKHLQLFLSIAFLSLVRYQKRNQILDQLPLKK